MRQPTPVPVSEVSLEVCHVRDLPTLHTICMSGRLKTRFLLVMDIYAGGQRRFVQVSGPPDDGTRHTVGRRPGGSRPISLDAGGRVPLGRPDRMVGGGVVDQTGFEAFQPEGRQHQQPGDERDEQPRHKAEVNTPKISG